MSGASTSQGGWRRRRRRPGPPSMLSHVMITNQPLSSNAPNRCVRSQGASLPKTEFFLVFFFLLCFCLRLIE
ncbi:uncharacterized protein BO97DRAFT_183252 [Aspergillus homomorphus CBS 101889]|uniref:Uncharacterized protein n=1 Tax=Aspergillus homomorphus (strain CBS 101889) TaxID=1450537 RepID=A0A395I834_ASPHC|nr:hypothetical protein BO97DRAFT_183252 [Aspergillus homomorphus CBS 101889]RAL16105.1 hypothetical protein BO97DRAFT_183252 [Aspergillus homomorphus CBS 101889]